MKISVDEIPQSPKEIHFSERIEELNELYRRTQNRDFVFPPSLEVDLVYYRSGQDIFFSGTFRGLLKGRCSRCIEEYSFKLDKPVEIVFTTYPTNADPPA